MPHSQVRNDLSFRAAGTTASLTFDVEGVDGFNGPIFLDNIAVSVRKYYRDNQILRNDTALNVLSGSSRVSGGQPGNDADCCEPAFEFPASPAAADVPFFDTFAGAPEPGWSGVDGFIVKYNGSQLLWDGCTPPRCAGARFPAHADLTGSLQFDDDGAISRTLSGLTPGETYIVTFWFALDPSVNTNTLPQINVIVDGVFEQPRILLVDDDDNVPDGQGCYREVLDALGMAYDVWDPETGSCAAGSPGAARTCGELRAAPTVACDPDPVTLARYSTVLWFSGDKGDNPPDPAGPTTPTGEGHLGDFLEDLGCLVISSQDYLFDANGGGGGPPTAFMTGFLGATSVDQDVMQTQVSGTGGGDVSFSGLGPYTLVFPAAFVDNYSDKLTPSGSSNDLSAFAGNRGGPGECDPPSTTCSAAIYRQFRSFLEQRYQTAWFGFPLEALPTFQDRFDVLAQALKLCDLSCPKGSAFPFHLDLQPGFVNSKACNSLHAEGLTLATGSVQTFLTGNVVTLGNDFSTGDANSLRIEIGPVDR